MLKTFFKTFKELRRCAVFTHDCQRKTKQNKQAKQNKNKTKKEKEKNRKTDTLAGLSPALSRT